LVVRRRVLTSTMADGQRIGAVGSIRERVTVGHRVALRDGACDTLHRSLAKLPMTHLIDLPEDVAQRAALLVASGRFASVEDAVRAGMEAIAEIAEDERAASEAAWSAYLARGASDPRDLSAREALACIGSDDPARRRAFDAHVDTLCRDMDDGKGVETTPAGLIARVRARLGVPPR